MQRVSNGPSSTLAEYYFLPGTPREPFHVLEAKKKGKGEGRKGGQTDRQTEPFPRRVSSRAQALLGARRHAFPRGSRFQWEKLIIKLLECLRVTVLSPSVSEPIARLGEGHRASHHATFSVCVIRAVLQKPLGAGGTKLFGFLAAPLAESTAATCWLLWQGRVSQERGDPPQRIPLEQDSPGLGRA